jgi:hypothetical protein
MAAEDVKGRVAGLSSARCVGGAWDGVRCLPTTTYLERRGHGSARIHAATCSGPVGAR